MNASQGFDSLIPYLSEITHFWFGRMIAIAVFVIFLFGFVRAKDDWIGGFAVAGYVTFVVSLIFWVIGFITGLDFAIVIGVTIISSVILFTQKSH